MSKYHRKHKQPQPPKGAYLSQADLQQIVDEGIVKQGGRKTDPGQKYTCWHCRAETKDVPHDADGSGETGMMWPSCCLECCRTIKELSPIRVDAFKERFPEVKFALAAESITGLQYQAYYRMLVVRGWTPNSPQGSA